MSTAETYIDAPVTRAEVEAGAWVRPEHAASALGCDERTIRRRVRSGALVRTELGGRVYVRQAPPLPPTSDTARPAPEHELELAQAFAVVERLALELGQARAAVGHLERVRQVEQEAQAAHRAHLEHELGTVRHLAQAIGQHAQREQARANATEAQLEQARAQLEHERQRAARLEALARTPWYAVRVRRRLRRELTLAV